MFDIFNYVFFTIAVIIVIYPLYFIVISSISDPLHVAAGKVVFYPKGFTIEGYEKVMTHDTIPRGYLNSIFYTCLGTFINLLLTLPPGYALSKKDLVFKNQIMVYLVIPMYISGGLIPTYILIKNLDMLDKIWSLLIPGAVSVWNIIIARTFFQSNIPNELWESAMMDGCRHTRFFLSIVLPLSMPLVSVMILFYGIGHWNAWFNALIYIRNRKLFPLQLVLREVLFFNDKNIDFIKDPEELVRRQRLAESIKYASIIVASVPVLMIYPFLQKYFTKGIMVGSLKG